MGSWFCQSLHIPVVLALWVAACVQKDSLSWKLYFRIDSCSPIGVSVERVVWALEEAFSFQVPWFFWTETKVHLHLHQECALIFTVIPCIQLSFQSYERYAPDRCLTLWVKKEIWELWVEKNIETDRWLCKWVSREYGRGEGRGIYFLGYLLIVVVLFSDIFENRFNISKLLLYLSSKNWILKQLNKT